MCACMCMCMCACMCISILRPSDDGSVAAAGNDDPFADVGAAAVDEGPAEAAVGDGDRGEMDMDFGAARAASERDAPQREQANDASVSAANT